MERGCEALGTRTGSAGAVRRAPRARFSAGPVGAPAIRLMETAPGLMSVRGSRRWNGFARLSWLIPKGNVRKIGLYDFPSVRGERGESREPQMQRSEQRQGAVDRSLLHKYSAGNPRCSDNESSFSPSINMFLFKIIKYETLRSLFLGLLLNL